MAYNEIPTMPTFHFFNFGCRASQADGAALKKQLVDAGLREVDGVDQSWVTVLNTCTVTANADAEVRQVVRRIHRSNPQCQILVTGCYAQRAPNEIARLPGVKWVVGNSHKHNVAEILSAELGQEPARATSVAHPPLCTSDNSTDNHGLVQIFSPGKNRETAVHLKPARLTPGPDESTAQVRVGEISQEFHFAPVFPDDRTRPTLKVQDGCGARCSFCIIPTVRGPSRSLPADTVIAQIHDLERAGFMEIVLSGINLGSYGRDLGRQINFPGLLERILKETTVARVRISSIEPMDVNGDLIQLVAGARRMAQHFHVPLQSGCDRILRQMNRRYWARQYAERIHAIRERIPNCAIGADVMVGFPGESDKDHSATMRFLEALPLTYIHVFPYSSRPSTLAAAMPGQVNGRISHERGREIRSLIAAKHREFLTRQVDRILPVLTLDECAQEERIALSSNYLKVALPASTVPSNTLLDVRVGRTDGSLLYAYDAADSTTQSYKELSLQV